MNGGELDMLQGVLDTPDVFPLSILYGLKKNILDTPYQGQPSFDRGLP